MNELDQYITNYNKKRKREKSGRTVGVSLAGGELIIGELLRHETNKLYVKDWLDHDMEKEIHRATVKRFMIIIDGGGSDGGTVEGIYKRKCSANRRE